MELESFCSDAAITLEMIICFTSQALVVETALIVEKCLDSILLAILSLHSDVFPKIIQEKESIFWPLVCGVREPAAESDYGVEGTPGDDVGQEQGDLDNQGDGNGYGEDQMSDGGDGNSEGGGDDEYSSDSGTGSSGGDEGEDEEEEYDKEGYWVDDDDEEYDEDEDEEEESLVDRQSKKQKFWAANTDETTDSESDDDTDEDEPGYGSLKKHAREVYKPTSFHIFEHEYKKSRTLSVDVRREDWDKNGLVFEYDVQKIGHHFDYRKHRVIAWPMDGIIKCDCKYFDVAGILCGHALTVLGCLRIENIPEQYILQRHIKNASVGLPGEEATSPTEDRKGKGSSIPDLNHQSRLTETNSASKEVAEASKKVAEDCLEMNMDTIDAPLLRHARDVYVPDVFLTFQEEYKQSEYVFLSRDRETYVRKRGIVLDCTVIYPRHSKRYKVHAETEVGRVDCSCNGFQKTGVLCCHALCVLESLCIERIPDQYIPMASRKYPEDREVRGIHGANYSELARFSRYNAVITMFEDLSRKASQTEETTKFMLEEMDKLLATLKDPSLGIENSSETEKPSKTESERLRTKDVNGTQRANSTEEDRNDKEIGVESDLTLVDCSKGKGDKCFTASDDALCPSYSPSHKCQLKLEASSSDKGTLGQDKKW